jgi:hypothetical protein
MRPPSDSEEPIHPMITDTWPVATPLELALWVGALSAVAGGFRVHIGADVAELARQTRALRPPRGCS